jgi:hypothetical protein
MLLLVCWGAWISQVLIYSFIYFPIKEPLIIEHFYLLIKKLWCFFSIDLTETSEHAIHRTNEPEEVLQNLHGSVHNSAAPV